MYGMFLYEVIHAKHPFEEISNVLDVSEAVVRGERPPLAVNCPMEILVLFERCWKSDPADRMSMNEIAHYLQTFTNVLADSSSFTLSEAPQYMSLTH